MRRVDPKRLQRAPRSGTIGHTAITVAIVVTATSISVVARLVHDMSTLADLFSILAFLVALSIYYVARQFSSRARRAREYALLEGDRRDREHVTYLIRLCRQLVRGISASTQAQPMLSMASIPQIATVAGTILSRYGHLVNGEGRLAAIDVQDAAMEILGSGAFCSATHVTTLTADLAILVDSVLDIDDPSLVERRRHAADASDLRPE